MRMALCTSGSDWGLARRQHLAGPWQVAMLTLLAFCLPLGVLLQDLQAQELEFLVVNTSVTLEQAKNMSGRNSYSLMGHNMRMICRYRVYIGKDYCMTKKNVTLVVGPVFNDMKAAVPGRLVEIERTNCSLTVEFVNMTRAMEGRYKCEDKTANKSTQRAIKVGDAPVKPKNVSLEYLPLREIKLYLDPVMTGKDLNDHSTLWNVQYKWTQNFLNCKSKDRKCIEPEEGKCLVCRLQLKDYNYLGMYIDYGHLQQDINFEITVTNYFGSVTSQKTFNLSNWVKPDAINKTIRVDHTQNSITMAVNFSRYIDCYHIELMNKTSYPLKMLWRVEPIGTEQHSRLQGEGAEFFERYGFVRNLEADETALRQHLSNYRAFPHQHMREVTSLGCQWGKKLHNCKEPSCVQHVVIPDLPIPGYHYNLSVQSLARYIGPTIFTNVSSVQTKEAAPTEGPELHSSLAYCDNTVQLSGCVTCVLYFKEIPRVKRGSGKVNYTITLTLINANSLQHRCSSSDYIIITAMSQDNSVLVHNIEAGGNYNVSVEARNVVGSAVSTKTLHVHATPPPTAPRNIVVQKDMSGEHVTYELSWAPLPSGQSDDVQMYVHHCNASMLQLQRDSINQPLQCVTNMLSLPVINTGTFSIKLFNFKRHQVETLVPAFFVSTVTANGVSSGLHRADCFFTSKMSPEKVKQIQVQSSFDTLTVTFFLPCGDRVDYPYGRPRFYTVNAIPMEGSISSETFQRQCGRRMQPSIIKPNFVPKLLMPQDNLKKLVEFEQHGVEPDTDYLVGVIVAGSEATFEENNWHCSVARTKSKPVNLLILLVLIPIGAVILVFTFIWWRTNLQTKKFNLEVQDLDTTNMQLTDRKEVVVDLLVPGFVDGHSNPMTNSLHNGSAVAHFTGLNHLEAGTASPNESAKKMVNSNGRYPGFRFQLLAEGSPSSEDTECSLSDCGSDEDEDSEDHSESEGMALLPEDHHCGEVSRLQPADSGEPENNEETRDEETPFASAELLPSPDLCENIGSDQMVHCDSTHLKLQSLSSCSVPPPTSYPSPVQFRIGEFQSLEHDVEVAGQSTSNIGGISIDQILIASETKSTLGADGGRTERTMELVMEDNAYQTDSFPPKCMDFQAAENLGEGAIGGRTEGMAESEHLSLENILRAAEMCPWKSSVNLQQGMEGQGDGRMLAKSNRDSACFSDSTRNTDPDSESISISN